MHWREIPADALAVLRRGAVMPAHLLALDANRRLDRRRQRALTRYYLDAGSGGLAVGVHSTQFAVRDVGLYEPVLELAAQTAAEWTPLDGRRPLVLIAGLAGRTAQATREAQSARHTVAYRQRHRSDFPLLSRDHFGSAKEQLSQCGIGSKRERARGAEGTTCRGHRRMRE